MYTTLDSSEEYAIEKAVYVIMQVNLDHENRTKCRDQPGTAGMDHLDTAYFKDVISPFLKPASFSSATDTYYRRCASV